MTDMSWEHAAEARAALNAIVTDPEHGTAALSSPQTMSNLLKDFLPDAPREKSILVAAAEAGLAATLRDHVSQGMDAGTAIRLTASSFASSTPFTPEACTWVTSELAVALGLNPPDTRPPAASQPGGQGMPAFGQPAGQLPGQQGMPTQVVPGAGASSAPGQGPVGSGQTYGQPTGQGYPQQGYPPRQGYTQPPASAPGGPMGPQATVGAWQQQGPGYSSGGTAPGGYNPQGGYGPPAGYGPPGGMPPRKPGGSKRTPLFTGGAVVAVIAIIAIYFAMRGPAPKPTPKTSTTPTTAPATTPATTPAAAGGVQPLAQIMDESSSTPVGSNCGSAKTYPLKSSTLVSNVFCPTTSATGVVVWGYQFDSYSDYTAGLASMNSYAGFNASAAGTSCPPANGAAAGLVGWHANSNPLFPARSGQDLECSSFGKYPTLLWTMPTQHTFFVAQDQSTAASLTALLDWWKTLSYG